MREKSRLDAIKAANNLPVIGSAVSVSSAAEEEPATPATGTSSPSGKGTRGRPPRGAAAKKQLEAALKAEKEKQIKIYKLKYDKYLVAKPATNSPFDILIAATQVNKQ